MTHYHNYLVRLNCGFTLPSHVGDFFGAMQAQFPCVRIELDGNCTQQPGVEVTGTDMDALICRSMEQFVDEYIDGYIEDLHRADGDKAADACFTRFYGHRVINHPVRPNDVELDDTATMVRNVWLDGAMKQWEDGYSHAIVGLHCPPDMPPAWRDGHAFGSKDKSRHDALRKEVTK